MWVSSNFRWQVQNTSHRSDHKCRLEYRSPCNTLWCCKEAAVLMKGNKPICKKNVVKKKNEKKGKKYLGQQANMDHLNVKSTPSLLCHITKYKLSKENYYI